MCDILSMKTLEDMKARYATLGVYSYTLPVPFRVRGQAVECRVPTWSYFMSKRVGVFGKL